MIPDTLFFALVSDSEHEMLYIGYGQMCPQGNYVLVALDPSPELLADIFLADDEPGMIIDVMSDFDVWRDLFVMPYQPDKRDWDDLSKFHIISRAIFDPIASLYFLEGLSIGVVEEALARAEFEVRESGSDSEATYERIEQIHTMRGGVAVAAGMLEQAQHRQSTAEALRDKLKKLKGDA